MKITNLDSDIKEIIRKYKIPHINGLIDYRFSYSKEIHLAVSNVLDNEMVWRANSQGICRLKDSFQEHIFMSKFLTPVSSCSSGLYTLLKYFINDNNKKVLIPAYSWLGVLRTVINAGGEPVFWDLSKDSLKLNEKIDYDNVSCCIVSHLFGIPSVSTEQIQILRQKNIPIIEDCAQCITGKVGTEHVGQIGLASVFSFNGSKHIPVGEGGIISTNSIEIYEFCDNFIMNVYSSDEIIINRYNLNSYGWNFRLSAIHASIASSLIQQLDKRHEKSRHFNHMLNNILAKSNSFDAFDYSDEYFLLGFPTILKESKQNVEERRAKILFLLKFIGIEVSVWMNTTLSKLYHGDNFTNTPNSIDFSKSHLIFKEVQKFNGNENLYFDILQQIDQIICTDEFFFS